VLRITSTQNIEAGTLKVEGRVAGDWVGELSRAAAAARAVTPHVVLDLSEVTFVDAEGVALLRALRESGFALAECSAFVASLIDGGLQ
jgi:anti-anti-sigma regulatory factor